MSNQTNSFPSPLSDEIVKNIDQLNLPLIKKHHVRLLAHCLEVFKEIGKDEKSFFEEDELLKKWCEKNPRSLMIKISINFFMNKCLLLQKKSIFFLRVLTKISKNWILRI